MQSAREGLRFVAFGTHADVVSIHAERGRPLHAADGSRSPSVSAGKVPEANQVLSHKTGFLFAYFLQAFANYGPAGRLNSALSAAGSAHTESPLACFFLTGFPFSGAKKRIRRGTERLNDAARVHQSAAA